MSIEPSQQYRGVAYLNSGYRRGLDVLISLLLFVPVHFVLALAWLAARLRGQTSFLYIQERIGRGGHSFRIYKVRTIRINHPSAQEFTHTPNDLLPLGAFLRRLRVDELPQIWNVLRGEMSWIGPRPEVPFHYHQCAQALMGYEDRQLVLPGITGWAQINDLRGEVQELEEMSRRVKHDLYYIEHWSLWFDVRIILATVLKIFFSKKAW